MESKTCVLFGAGAEICLNLPSGGKFAKTIIGIGNENINRAVFEYYKSKQDKKVDSWYPKIPDKKDFESEKDAFLRACIKKSFLDNGILFNLKDEFDENVEEKIKSISNDEEAKNEIFDKYTSYMGTIDEKFHTLIAPKSLGPYKFWNVVLAYARAYLSVASPIVYENPETITPEQYRILLEKPEIVGDKIIEFCNKFEGENYYKILKNKRLHIVTANYSDIIKNISGIDDEYIAFVHGNLKLFESAKTLSVIDCKNKAYDNDLYFPFLTIQSGVKPIVHPLQIKEYAKMCDYFEHDNKLVIVGYRLNYDDNHINAAIRSFIADRVDTQLVYLQYGEIDETFVYRQLRLEDAEENIKKRISIISIDDSNCFKKFKEEIEE